MAIQMRRGAYSAFDPSKLVVGEWAVVTSGDPNTSDGRAVYLCVATGVVKRFDCVDDIYDYVAGQHVGTDQLVDGAVTAAKLAFGAATSSSMGLMSAADKAKLDGIAAGANNYVHPSYTARTGKPTANQTPGFGSTFTVSQITSDATGHVTGATDRTVKIPSSVATSSAAGLMSAADKSNLDNIRANGAIGTANLADGAVTDAKLIQHGGILDRVARLWHRLDNLLTATPAESDSLTVTDAAKTPLAGLALYGRSTQSGTPTPSSPVAIQSVTPNLYRETVYAIGQTWTNTVSVTKADYNRYIVNGTSTGTHWLWGGGNSSDDRLYVTLPAGTYTAVLGGADASKFSIATRGKINGSVTALSTSGNPNTFTIDSEMPVEVAIYTLASKTFTNSEVSIQLYEGSSAGGAFVPYGSVGLWSKRTSDATQQSVTPIDLQGHALRSLPDGTRDEVTVDQYGHAVLTQRVEEIELDGSSDEPWGLSGGGGYRVYSNIINGLCRPNSSTSVVMPLVCNRFTAVTAVQTYNGTVGVSYQNDLQISNGSAMNVQDWRTWLASNPITVLYPLATPQTIDLGTVDPVALQGPDMTAQSVPTAPFQLTYERDLNVTLARLEAAIADAATA